MIKWLSVLAISVFVLLVVGALCEPRVAGLLAIEAGVLFYAAGPIVARLRRLSSSRLIVLWSGSAAVLWGICAARTGTMTTAWFTPDPQQAWLVIFLMACVLALWGTGVVLAASWPAMGVQGGGIGLATAAVIGATFAAQVTTAYLVADDFAYTDWTPVSRYYGNTYGLDGTNQPLGVASRAPVALGESQVGWAFRQLQPVSTVARLFERVADAVVMIMVDDHLYGTAFIVRSDGLALTAWHVVKNGNNYIARFRDGSVRNVRVLRWNAKSDVALLQIDGVEDSPWLDVQHQEAVVGSEVIVIGHPVHEALDHTVTRGIVSGVRVVDGVKNVQTDAAINGGNSGGPVIDVQTGRAIGIVSWGIRYTDGLGFAIAMDHALEVLDIDELFESQIVPAG